MNLVVISSNVYMDRVPGYRLLISIISVRVGEKNLSRGKPRDAKQ